MSKQDKQKKTESATKITYQWNSHGFKLKVLAEIENGQISINQVALKYEISRAAIQKWMKKMGNFDKKLRQMGGQSAKEEIKRLKQKNQGLRN